MMLALLEPSIKFAVPGVVFTLASSEAWTVIYTIKINEVHFYIRSFFLRRMVKFTECFRVRHVRDQCSFITYLLQALQNDDEPYLTFSQHLSTSGGTMCFYKKHLEYSSYDHCHENLSRSHVPIFVR